MVTNSRTLFLVGIFLLLTVLFYQPLPVVQAFAATESTPEVSYTNHKVYLPMIAKSGTCLSEEEIKLGNLINQYRAEKDLAPIAFSRSLTQVAQAHVHDLFDNRPATGNCNLHSWSDKGTWTPVCYTFDHKNAEGMWLKPQEITNGIYTEYGYEIAYWHSAQATAERAFAGWKSSSGHNAVMIEDSIWEGMNWQAMGIGIYRNYAVVWFGQSNDPQGSVTACTR